MGARAQLKRKDLFQCCTAQQKDYSSQQHIMYFIKN